MRVGEDMGTIAAEEDKRLEKLLAALQDELEEATESDDRDWVQDCRAAIVECKRQMKEGA